MSSSSGSGGGGGTGVGAEKRVVDSFAEIDASGDFKRSLGRQRSWIKADGSTPFKPARGRYHLYVSLACPWAHRCLAVRALKGLGALPGLAATAAAVTVSVVAPTWARTRPDDPEDGHRGWVFAEDRGVVPDPFFSAASIREVYEKSGAEFTKPTVPVLFDKESGQIVSNESSEIIRMLNAEFNDFAAYPGVDLLPADKKEEIDAINAWVYDNINNGVYRCGFAQSQEAYDAAVERLFSSLDRAEDILSRQRYLVGDTLTEADIRLFVTLIRFDEVYVVHFKCNKKLIREYPALHGFMLDVYQTPGIADTVDMYHIKKHYYTSHPAINPYSIIPAGSPEDLSAPHGRDALFPGTHPFGRPGVGPEQEA